MGKLYFRVASDYEEVVKLRTEIEKLKQTLLSMNKNITPDAVTAMEVRLGEAKKEFNNLAIEAAKAGAIMENDFKKGIYQGSQAVNDLTQKIISQRNEIGTMQITLRKNKDLYKTIVSSGNEDKTLLSRIGDQEKALWKEKDALFKLTQEQANARLSVKKLRDEYAVFQNDGKKVVETNESMAISFKKTLAAIGGIAAIKQFGSEVLKIRGQFQQLDVAFTTLLQSKEKANALMAQMVQTAAKTPFNLTELATGAKQLVAYGFASEGVNDTLIRLGNIASGLSLPLERLTYLYGTTMTQGILYKRDLNQFTTSGIPMLQGLADMFGVTTQEVNEMVTAGKIGFPEVQKVIENMTNEGGKFFNLMEEQSKTITGKISNLGDAWDLMLNKIGESQEGVINGSLDMAKYLVENYEAVGKILTGLIGIYGTYRTALIFNAILEQGFTKAVWAKVTATKAATLAQAAYNKVLMTNPYVMAGAALVSLGIAMWALHDSTTAAEKAQEQYNKKVEDANKYEQDRKNNLEALVNELKNECTADLRRLEIIGLIKKEYPSFFKFLLDEQGHVRDLTEAWKAYNETVAQDKVNSNKANVDNLRKSISEQKRFLELFNMSFSDRKNVIDNSSADKSILMRYSGKGIKNIEKEIEKNERELWKWEKKVREDSFNQWQLDLKDKTDEQIEASRAALVKRAKAANGDKNLMTALGKRISAIDNEKKARNQNAEKKPASEWLSSYKKAYEDAEKAYNDFLKSKQVMSDADRDKELERLKGVRDTAKKTYEAKGGSVSSDNKQENQAEKLRQQQEKLTLLLDKQALEQSRSEEDMQNHVDQARIDAMKEGSEKTIAQMELNFEREMQQLEREKEDKLRKAIEDARALFDAQEDAKSVKNPKYVKQTFNASEVKLSDTQVSAFDSREGSLLNKQAKESQELLDDQKRSWDEYLSEYSNFQERKQALTRLYNNKIEKATSPGEKATLKKEFESKSKSLKLDEVKENLDFSKVFGNLDNLSTDTIDKLRDKLKEYIQKASKDLKPEDLKVLQDALQDMDFKVAERNPFGELVSGLKEYKSSMSGLKDAQQILEATQEKGYTILTKYDEKTKQTTYKLITQKEAQEALINAENTRSGSLAKMTKAANSIGDKGQQVVNAGKDICDMLGNFGVEVPEAITGALDGMGQVMEGLSSIDLTSPFSAITGSVKILTGLGNAIASIFNGEKRVLSEETIRQYEGLISIIDELIDRQKELIATSDSASAQIAADEAKRLLNKQVNSSKSIGTEWLNSYNDSKHTVGYNLEKDLSGYSSEIEKAGLSWKKIYGSGRMEGLFSLTPEELKTLQKEVPDAWAKIDDKTKGYLQNIIDSDEKLKDIDNALNESLTGVSFDSLVDNFKSALSDMNSTAEDFAEDFEQYMMDAIINSFINGDEFKKKLEAWHKKFAEYSKSNNEIDENEKEELKKEWEAIVQEGVDYRNGVMETMGFDSSESTSQSSTQKGFTAMSQDSADELNGRFTALQMSGEEIKNQNILQSQSLNLLTMKTDAILSVNTEVRNIADETRTILANSYLELVQISENTGESAKHLKDIKSDIAEVKRNTSRL